MDTSSESHDAEDTTRAECVQGCLSLSKGETSPPIHVVPVEHGRFSVSDGHVRVQAHKLLGRDYILARYAKEDRNEVK
jgi:hypothetical protein